MTPEQGALAPPLWKAPSLDVLSWSWAPAGPSLTPTLIPGPRAILSCRHRSQEDFPEAALQALVDPFSCFEATAFKGSCFMRALSH